MKTKLIFLILALSLFAISCDNSEEKRRQQEEEQQRIEEEERKKLIDSVTKDLKSKEWEYSSYINDNGRTINKTYILEFTEVTVKYTYTSYVVEWDHTNTITKDGVYKISDDGKNITIKFNNVSYTLSYSKDKLCGLWENKYLEFVAKPI